MCQPNATESTTPSLTSASTITKNQVRSHNNDNMKSAVTVTNIRGESVQVPPEYVCPITLEPFYQPVMTRDGRRFERKAIFAWLAQHDHTATCPLTRTELRPSDLVPDNKLAFSVKCWRKRYDIAEPEAAGQDDNDNMHNEAGDYSKRNGCRMTPERVSLAVLCVPEQHFGRRPSLSGDASSANHRRREELATPARRRRFLAGILSSLPSF